MIMADIFKFLFPIVGTLMSFVCYCLLFEGTFPGAVERCRQTYLVKPIRSTVLGIVVGIPGIGLGIAMLSSGNPLGQFLGSSLLFLLTTLAILGSAGLASLIGHRLNSPQDEQQPWKRVYRGGIVLSITFLFPMVGWFLVLPFTLLSGLGAALISLKGRKKHVRASAEPGLDVVQA
jgi:hypothetical protein